MHSRPAHSWRWRHWRTWRLSPRFRPTGSAWERVGSQRSSSTTDPRKSWLSKYWVGVLDPEKSWDRISYMLHKHAREALNSGLTEALICRVFEAHPKLLCRSDYKYPKKQSSRFCFECLDTQSRSSARVRSDHNNHRENSENHNDRLEDISPHNRLDSSLQLINRLRV